MLVEGSSLRSSVYLFVGGAAARYEHHVEDGEAADRNAKYAGESDEHNGDYAWHIGHVLLVVHDEPQAHAEYDEHVRGERHQELKEVLVVTARDAVAHPLLFDVIMMMMMMSMMSMLLHSGQ